MMKRTIQIETSQFDPAGYWLPGAECHVVDVEIEYPESLDHLSDEELDEMAADENVRVVIYVELVSTSHPNPRRPSQAAGQPGSAGEGRRAMTDILAAIKTAVRQGWLLVDIGSFQGWNDDCQCEQCQTQRVIYAALFGDEALRATRGTPATRSAADASGAVLTGSEPGK